MLDEPAVSEDAVTQVVTPPPSEEPLPWWERQAVRPAETAAAAIEAPPVPSSAAPAAATTPSHPPVNVVPRPPAPTRIIARPPTPGAVTRPGQPRTWRRRIFLGSASVVVALAMGIPLAERWLFARSVRTIDDQQGAAIVLVGPVDSSPAPRPTYTKAAPIPEESQKEPLPPANGESDAAAKPSAQTKRRTQAAAKGLVAPALASVPAAAPDASMFSAASGVSTPAPPPPPPVAPVVAAPIGPVFEPNQVEQRPQVTSQTEPRVPDELRARPLSDLVIVRILVSQVGRPSEVSVLRRSKSGPALDAAVVAAVRQWSFTPARRRGQAVSCWYNVGVPLRSDGARPTP